MTRLNHSFAYVAKPKAPYSFELTVHKPAGWSLFTQFEVYENGTLWTALTDGEELIGLKLRSLGTTAKPEVEVRVFSSKPLVEHERSRLKNDIASKLGFDEDIRPFYRMARKDSVLKHTLPDLYGMHDTDSSSLFDTALLAICLQMAQMKRSDQMMEALMNNYGATAEFDGKSMRVWPTPREIAKHTAAELARKCNLGYRAKSIVKLAKLLSGKRFYTLEQLKAMHPREAKEKILELPGIGDYSADIINPHGGFPIDVWSADIFGMLFYGREPKNGRDAIERIKNKGLRRWGEWSWMAFYYVVQDLKNLSKKLGVQLRLE